MGLIMSRKIIRNLVLPFSILVTQVLLVACSDGAGIPANANLSNDSSGSSADYGAQTIGENPVVNPLSSSSVAVESPSIIYGSLTDNRDGMTYRTVVIGTQTWMAENLNYAAENSYCYENEASNCTKYGRLYTWATAMGICPEGWHLPDSTEWKTLVTAVGDIATSGKVLKSRSGWCERCTGEDANGTYKSANGTDDYGFSALPAGKRFSETGNFGEVIYFARFWSATYYSNFDLDFDLNLAYQMNLAYTNDDAYMTSTGKDDALAVRCVENSN